MAKDSEEPGPIGRRLREARERAGLSRDDVVAALRSDESRLSVRTMYRYEHRMVPGTRRLAELAELYGVSMHWLATGREPGEPAEAAS